MFKAKVRATFFALALPLLLNATHILKDDILKIEASALINEMGDELLTKTGINGYVIATNESFPVGFNLVEYSKKYEANMSKPYVLFIFAPQAFITEKSESKGRVGIIPSSPEIRTLYDYNEVRDAGIDVVAVKDSNKIEDKHNIGVLQAFSELCEGIAKSKGVELTKTIPNDTRYVVWGLKVFIFTGSLLVLWIFFIRPRLSRRKNGTE
jgi:preprotein translocase subunit YajC